MGADREGVWGVKRKGGGKGFRVGGELKRKWGVSRSLGVWLNIFMLSPCSRCTRRLQTHRERDDKVGASERQTETIRIEEYRRTDV